MTFVDYETPIPQEDYLASGLVSAVLGFFLIAYFFIYQVAFKQHERKIRTEILTAFFASAFLSVGVIFLFLHVGIYL